jgi:hypothetical protein
LDANCTAPIAIHFSTNSANRATVFVALCKAFEMFHVLVQAYVAEVMGALHTTFVHRHLVLRGLDIAVMFGIFYFERKDNEHATDVQEAEDIHTSIEKYFFDETPGIGHGGKENWHFNQKRQFLLLSLLCLASLGIWQYPWVSRGRQKSERLAKD